MRFTHKGTRITLHGLRTDLSKCTAISAGKLKGLIRRGALTHCVQMWPKSVSSPPSVQSDTVFTLSDSDLQWPAEIQNLIQQYAHVFKEPTQLPPARYCDHSIDLIPGAQPITIRPYRYAPAQKSEIERQLAEMLKNGIIRPSTDVDAARSFER